jgi:hypothetical protein
MVPEQTTHLAFAPPPFPFPVLTAPVPLLSTALMFAGRVVLGPAPDVPNAAGEVASQEVKTPYKEAVQSTASLYAPVSPALPWKW